MRYRGDLSRYLDWMVFAYGSHASSELTLLDALAGELRQTQDHIFFFDIGANMGGHTLFMAGKADAVIAFEPYAPLRELILEKIALNRLTHVRIVPFALGEIDETKSYYPGHAVNSGTGTFLPDEEEGRSQPVLLEIRNGDSLCGVLNLPKIDILKVDVEGFEPMVFRGLAERIRKDRPAILTEFTERSRAGYRSEEEFRKSFWDGAIFAWVTGRNGCSFKLKPFSYRESSEILIVPPEMGQFVESHLRA